MFSPTKIALAALGLTLLGTAHVATAAPRQQTAAGAYECFTDDGYGRKRPCSAGYQKQKQAEQPASECMTDDGYGRKRSCAAGVKR
jgi:hypothetical protein